jgi:hypothetical protein
MFGTLLVRKDGEDCELTGNGRPDLTRSCLFRSFEVGMCRSCVRNFHKQIRKNDFDMLNFLSSKPKNAGFYGRGGI